MRLVIRLCLRNGSFWVFIRKACVNHKYFGGQQKQIYERTQPLGLHWQSLLRHPICQEKIIHLKLAFGAGQRSSPMPVCVISHHTVHTTRPHTQCSTQSFTWKIQKGLLVTKSSRPLFQWCFIAFSRYIQEPCRICWSNAWNQTKTTHTHIISTVETMGKSLSLPSLEEIHIMELVQLYRKLQCSLYFRHDTVPLITWKTNSSTPFKITDRQYFRLTKTAFPKQHLNFTVHKGKEKC